MVKVVVFRIYKFMLYDKTIKNKNEKNGMLKNIYINKIYIMYNIIINKKINKIKYVHIFCHGLKLIIYEIYLICLFE